MPYRGGGKFLVLIGGQNLVGLPVTEKNVKKPDKKKRKKIERGVHNKENTTLSKL